MCRDFVGARFVSVSVEAGTGAGVNELLMKLILIWMSELLNTTLN